MSTILDALRKSEQERKLNKLPTLTDMAAPQEPSRWPVYIGIALVLVAIALVVLAYVIWSSNSPAVGTQGSNVDQVVSKFSDSENQAAIQSSDADQSRVNSDSTLVNVVSYSDDPALRFAMVNGKMVREGEFIEPGLKVEKILSDAVVFNARGKKITRSP